MKKFALCFVVTLLAILLTGVALAGGKPTVVINGGGIAENNNSGLPLGSLLSVGGFTARVTGGVAKGQVQSKTVSADDPTVTWGSIHGTVVCVMNLGPNWNSVSDGLVGDVWEVRFKVTKGSGIGLPLVTFHGSLFVLDGGSPGAGNDGIDEGFAVPGSAGCGGDDAASYTLEPVIAGNFTVHQ